MQSKLFLSRIRDSVVTKNLLPTYDTPSSKTWEIPGGATCTGRGVSLYRMPLTLVERSQVDIDCHPV